jgi:hypothetical protein
MEYRCPKCERKFKNPKKCTGWKGHKHPGAICEEIPESGTSRKITRKMGPFEWKE